MVDTHLNGDGNGPVPEPANVGSHLDAPPASGPSEALLKEMDEVMHSDVSESASGPIASNSDTSTDRSHDSPRPLKTEYRICQSRSPDMRNVERDLTSF